MHTHGSRCGVLGACPREIDACQYHGINYMVMVRLWGDPATSHADPPGDFRSYVHADAARW
ncbi:MAG TPA: hypothetical protein VIU36_01805, partial [Gammaproteobacteria bacterium]